MHKLCRAIIQQAWELLSRADAPTTAEPDRAALLSDALAAFLPAVSADASVDLAVLVDAFFAHHADPRAMGQVVSLRQAEVSTATIEGARNLPGDLISSLSYSIYKSH